MSKQKYKSKINVMERRNLPLTNDSDNEILIRIYNNRCEKSTKALYNRYYEGGYNYLLEMFDEDEHKAATTYNDTFIRVINALGRGEEKYRDEDNFNYKDYLFKSLDSSYRQDYWEKNGKQNKKPKNEEDGKDGQEEDKKDKKKFTKPIFEDITNYSHQLSYNSKNQEERLVRGEERKQLFEWLESILTPSQYSIYSLSLEGWSYEAISVEKGLSNDSVRGRLERIRKKIKDKYNF